MLKKLKIGCCNFANNHILDYDFYGVKDTIQFFNETRIKWFGFGKNWETAWKPRIIRLKTSNDASSEPEILKIALFGLSDHFVEWKADTEAGINYFDIDNFQKFQIIILTPVQYNVFDRLVGYHGSLIRLVTCFPTLNLKKFTIF